MDYSQAAAPAHNRVNVESVVDDAAPPVQAEIRINGALHTPNGHTDHETDSLRPKLTQCQTYPSSLAASQITERRSDSFDLGHYFVRFP